MTLLCKDGKGGWEWGDGMGEEGEGAGVVEVIANIRHW